MFQEVNRYNSGWLWVIVAVLLFAISGQGADEGLKKPDPMPNDVSIIINLLCHGDLVRELMRDEPPDDKWISPEMLSLSISGDGAVDGLKNSLLLEGVRKNRFARFSLTSTFAYMPQADVKRMHDQAFEAIRAFAFESQRDPGKRGRGDFDISFSLIINGRSIEISYRDVDRSEKLQKPLLDILSLVGRTLPREYERLWALLNVPEPPPLDGTLAEQYTKCEVHNEWMKVDTVPIHYGYPIINEEYNKASSTLFPNVRLYTLGGCVTGGSENQMVLYCPSCRAAEKKWQAERAGKKESTSRPAE